MFNEGQTVWCLIYGQGVVTDVDSERTEETYSVFVKFQNYDELHISYTMEGKFHNQGNVTLFPYPVEVIKATVTKPSIDEALTKPSIDWSHVKGKYKWLSVDKNGRAYVSEEKPTHIESDFWQIPKKAYFNVNGLSSYSRGTCNWRDSLVKRPN